jgi:inosine-uridine nucleoside N-ribohydrolase
VTMVGLDVTHQALVTRADAERLRCGGRAGVLVAELLDFYGRYHERVYGMAGSPVHDVVAVAQVVRPALLDTPPCRIEVECGSELCRGRTSVDLRRGGAPNARAATAVDARALVELIVERITSLG